MSSASSSPAGIVSFSASRLWIRSSMQKKRAVSWPGQAPKEFTKSTAEMIKKVSPSRNGWAWLPLFMSFMACQQQMADQPRYKPLQKSEFFDDQRASRPLVEGTVARGQLQADERLYSGKADNRPVATL